jgi:hypothetical protein
LGVDFRRKYSVAQAGQTPPGANPEVFSSVFVQRADGRADHAVSRRVMGHALVFELE